MRAIHYEKKEPRSNFMSGVLMLTVSTVLVKIIGLAYKIPMLAYLGAEGMGYFNSAYEIYAILCVISTAGLPIALSMLISAQRERGAFHSLYGLSQTALWLFLGLGSVGTILLMAFADRIALWIGNKGAVGCLIAIAPALLFVCFSSSVRGYYQGLNRMGPTAISQLIEAVGKLFLGVWFAEIGLKKGWDITAVSAMAVWGLTLGTFLSALFLLFIKITDPQSRSLLRQGRGGGLREESQRPLVSLLKIAVPITLGSAVLSVTRIVDMALILRRLQAVGIGVAEANRIYGSYTTLAVPVFSLIPSLITPISLALVPSLSAAIEKRKNDDQAEVADRSIRLTVLLSMPASLGIAVYAKPILSLLFYGESEAIAIAAPLLSCLGISILFSGLITTTNAILQSYRRTAIPIVSMTVGAVVKIIFAYSLIGIPSVGVLGAPISTFLCNAVVTGINFVFLWREIPASRKLQSFYSVYGKPLIASSLSILLSLGVYFVLSKMMEESGVIFLVAMLVTAVAYAGFVIFMKMMTDEDIAMLPLGNRLLSIKKKRHASGAQDSDLMT